MSKTFPIEIQSKRNHQTVYQFESMEDLENWFKFTGFKKKNFIYLKGGEGNV